MNRLERGVGEAILLGYRFPALSDQEVIEYINEFTGGVPTNPLSYYGQIYLMAYESKSVKATNRFIQSLGPGKPLDLEQPEDPT